MAMGLGKMGNQDSYTFRREVNGRRVTVSAQYMPSQDLFSVWVKVGKELVNTFHSVIEDLWADAQAAMIEAFESLPEEVAEMRDNVLAFPGA
jgi:hypothetical protein